MADNSKIEWTDATWNPIRARNVSTGGVGHFCTHASEGCRFCYSEAFQKRFNNPVRFAAQDQGKVEIFLDEAVLTQPLRWRRPRKIFPCSMTDLFGEFVPDWMIDRIFAVMALCPHHIFQPLTKRDARMREYLTVPYPCDNVATAWKVRSCGAIDDLFPLRTPHSIESKLRLCTLAPLPNVWLGVSAERQQEADERIPDLLATPAALRFVSYEPALGPIDFSAWIDRLDWIIAGGESGAKARPAHPDWFRQARDQCAQAGVPFFFKQWGEWIDWRQAGAGCWSNKSRFDRTGRVKGKYVGELSRAGEPLFHGRALETVISDSGDPIVRVGKKAAGRMLDGVTHNAFPGCPMTAGPTVEADTQRREK